MCVILVIAVLLLILSVFLLMGKGSFLIAGYNTMSQREKARIDEKRLCRLTGGYMLFLSALSFGLCAVMAWWPQLEGVAAGVYSLLVLLSTIGLVVYANVSRKINRRP